MMACLHVVITSEFIPEKYEAYLTNWSIFNKSMVQIRVEHCIFYSVINILLRFIGYLLEKKNYCSLYLFSCLEKKSAACC